MMGDGTAIIPEDGAVCAGRWTVTFVFPTKHAVGFRTDEGYEMLVHVGIDTVSLSGDGFESFVRDGDRVHAGDRLLKVEIQKIKRQSSITGLAGTLLRIFRKMWNCAF